MMAIQVRDAAQFERLMKVLAHELVDANIFFSLHTDLATANAAYGQEMNQSWTFWERTICAHLDAAVFRLCKIFDPNKTHLGLPGLLDTIRSNAHFFSPMAFAARVEGRPAFEHLTADLRELDQAQLRADIEYVTCATNARVDALIKVRNNFYSHRNARDVVAGLVVGEQYPLTVDDVGELLRGGMAISNRYYTAFSAESFSTRIVGRDDYVRVLKAVGDSVKAYKQAYEDDCRRYGIDPDTQLGG